MTGQAMELLKKGVDEAEVKVRLEQAVKQRVKVRASVEPVARLRAKTGGMSVVRTVWRRSGKGMVRGNEMTTQVWTVMTKEKVYQVNLKGARYLPG
jgi:hypothetical protein